MYVYASRKARLENKRDGIIKKLKEELEVEFSRTGLRRVEILHSLVHPSSCLCTIVSLARCNALARARTNV